MPPRLSWTGLAYAYINARRISVYKDNSRSSVSAQELHDKLGHNFNLAHAGEADNEYGDGTGASMGSSYYIDDRKMCYNAPNMYQLGWLTRVSVFTSRPTYYIAIATPTLLRGCQVLVKIVKGRAVLDLLQANEELKKVRNSEHLVVCEYACV